MPVLPSNLLLNNIINRSVSTTSSNTTDLGLQVVCAWPVSGQYGPGSRALYYVLVAACVFARKAKWLRNACLAAALLFPAVAALHGIVLAAVRVDGAVDMDIYGAFQLCSIGILAAPVTVRLSRTYFYGPGRNTIFLWTGLILSGLLSLTVSFFRIKMNHCKHDDDGNPIPPNDRDFPYGTTCGLICSPELGPHSPLRHGSANNIYVIPTPDKLTFGTATLLAAACCIPAILSLVSMWNKILEINWKIRFGGRDINKPGDELIEGTNGATVAKMSRVDGLIRLLLSAVEIPVFGAAVLAILIIGERNFFSPQVSYQSEPMAAIGQWAPVVGAGLAVMGSLFLNLESTEPIENPSPVTDLTNSSVNSVDVPRSENERPSFSNNGEPSLREITPTISRPADAGNRRKVAKALKRVSNYLGTAAHDQFDDSEFKHGAALDFPEIPGEIQRNPTLPQIKRQYNMPRENDVSMRPSRAPSFISISASGHDIEVGSTSPREGFGPTRSRSTSRPRTPTPSISPADRISFDLPDSPSPAFNIRQRRDTLDVPTRTYHSPRIIQTAQMPSNFVISPEAESSPTIVVSSDQAMTSLPDSPVVNRHISEPVIPSVSIAVPPRVASPPLSFRNGQRHVP